MNTSLPLVLGYLVAISAAAVGLGLLIHRLESAKGIIDKRDRRLVASGMDGTLGFVGGSAAFLLGVLLLSSLNHYNSTEDIVNDEALAYSAAFDSAAGLAAPDRAKIQRDLVCLMRSVSTNSWAATQELDLTGSENTHAWRTRVFNDANAVDPKTTIEKNSLTTLHDQIIEASKSGQIRLLAAENGLPVALWAVVYISIFVLTVILTVVLRPYPILAMTGLSGVFLLSAAMVGTLTVFAEPFSRDDGVYISPHAMQAVMVRMEGIYPGPAWEPCEELVAS